MPPNLLLLVVALLGFSYNALSTDGGGTVLIRLGVPARFAIPKGLVTPLVLLTGLGYAVVQGVQHGLSWQDAATQGALASLLALGGAMGSQHTLGRDAEGHSMPVTPPAKGLLMLVGLGFALTVSGCSLFSSQNLPTTLIDAGKVACIIERAFVDDATLNTVCNLVTAEERAAAKDIAKAHREQLGREMKGMRDAACDGGAK